MKTSSSMSAIEKIYANDIGISFFWKNQTNQSFDNRKVQVIFRDTGFLLNLYELKMFSKHCTQALATNNCAHCQHHKNCRNLLLRTPSDKIDLAVSSVELEQIQSLLNQTIFKVELKQWLESICLN